ncbi:lactate dehydrogenase [Photobacterium jeanii]|uniref:Lactate dehydrogenase n=2 Tax=Photobacterium jeanii TaxID=858640 RepID=A0A178K7T4_9GAMM|nr:lactate dehydrogenase [Photobacterium jeanii]OAN13380.1 lactate dehydrogenase [Photobacterium jeanii]PST91198.1 lactate dehydrogenase [Photobacterium jeanii]
MTSQPPVSSQPLLPEAAEHLQLNHCKTVGCSNYGSKNPDDYVIQRTNPNRPTLVCRECGAFPPVMNNQDVVDELTRLKLTQSSGLPACSNQECKNLGLPVLTHRHLYHAFGYSGDRQRYRCKCCQATFVDRWSGFNNKHLVQQKLLAMLFTGHAVRDICRRLSMNPKTFYDQLSHIASRCRRQLAMFDARLFKHAKELSLASNLTPLQPHSDNGVLWIASCEASSGYVVGQHLNYQATDHEDKHLEHDPFQVGTRFMAPPSVKLTEVTTQPSQGILARVDSKYREVLARPHLEDPLSNQVRVNYPTKGCLIRPQYTVYAHYLQLQSQLDYNQQLALFMPQEPLMRSAVVSIFLDRIKQKTIHPIYIEQDTAWQENMQAERIDIVLLGWWRDRWAFTRINEISKGICHLAGERENERFWLNTASDRAILQYQQRFHDHFAQLVDEPRRKLRPAGLLPLLDIYRAWHNLCRQDRNGQTPAQQMGLTAAPLTLEQLLS